LGVGSIEHCDVAVVGAFAVQFVDFVGDELGFVVCRVAGEADDLFAVSL